MIKWMANHIDKSRREKREEVFTSSSLFSNVNVTSNSSSFFGSFFVGFVENLAGAPHGGA